MRNGCLHLLFRVGNLRTKSHLVESHITVQMVTSETKGDFVNFNQRALKISTSPDHEEEHDHCSMSVPNIVSHRIDEDSPFYSLSPEQLLNAGFELVVYLEGIVESTGNTVQARTSFLPREILWGYTFDNMVSIGSQLTSVI